MVFDFVYQSTKVQKKDFFQWLIDTLKLAGWEDLSEDRRTKDYWVMKSKGESGDEEFYIQLREFGTDGTTAAYNFQTSIYGLISARSFHTYVKNPSASANSTYSPNSAYNDMRICVNGTTLEEEFTVYYHVNKDRIIFIVENSEHNPLANLSTTFFLLGKPHTVAGYNKYNIATVISSHGNVPCRAGVINNNSDTSQQDCAWYMNMFPKGNVKGTQFANDICISTAYDGIKYVVENILVTANNNDSLHANMREYTFEDSEGRVWKQCVNNLTTALTHASFRKFLIRIV